MVKTFDITYAKEDLKQVENDTTQMNAEEITQLLSPLKHFEGLFDGTLGDWDTDPVVLELNLDSKQFNCKYYMFPIIKK